MANSPRDVAFKVSVETLGTEGIKNLQQQLSELAKEGGNAAPEFKQLADEIQRLGEQSKVVNAIDALSSEIAEVAKSESEASTKASELRGELSSLSDTTERLRTAESSLKTELDEAKRALFDKGQELRKYKNEATDSEKKTEEFKNTVRAFNADLIAGQTSVRNLTEAHSKAKQEAREAANSEGELARELNQVAAAASKLKDELRAKGETLAVNKGQLEGLGSSYESIEKAEGSLLQRYGELADAIEREAQEIRKTKQEQLAAAESAKRAAEEKLAAEQEYARKLAVLNAQIGNAAKQATEERKAAEQEYGNKVGIINAEIAAAHKRVADVAAAEAKKAAEERIAAEKAAAVAAKQAADDKKVAEQEYSNRVGVINAQIAAARKAAEQSSVASSKQAAEEKIAAEKAVIDAANQTANALAAVGVRSSGQIKADIQKVNDSLDLLKRNGTLTGAELDAAFAQGQKQIKALERELRGVNNELTLTDRAANLFQSTMGQFAAGNLVANGVMLLAEKISELGRAFITTMVQGDQLNRGMNAIYKDTKLAASQIDFLRKASIETGVSFSEISTEFVKFSASMKSANIPLQQSNELFKAVTSASSALGLGTEATAGALNALAQMASKGTVSMEELRQQLGDRLPGVMGMTSKAMGITEGQLVKLVESGKLATRDFIVPFTKGLQDLKGDTDGVVPTLNKFKSALATIAQDVGAAGGLQVMTAVIKVLGGALTGVSVILSGFSEALFGVGKAAGVLVASLVTLTNPMESLKAILDGASERFSKQQQVLKALNGGYDAAAEAAKAQGDAIRKANEESRNAEVVTKAYSQALNLSKVAADLAAEATLNGAGSYTQFNVKLEESLAKQELQTDAANRNIRATEELGKEMVRIAELSGDETTIREAQTKAIDAQVVATENLAESKKAEVDLLVLQTQRLQEDAKERNLSAEQIKTQKDAIEKKLIPAQSELEEMQKTLGALRAEALARQLVSDALKDNSANVGKYADEINAAKASVEFMTDAEKRGWKTKDDVRASQEALSRATYLYNDAVKDSIEKLDRDTQAKKANLDIASAKASVGQSHYESLAREARALGDTAMATYYDIEAKKQSIKVLELKMEMERLQTAAALAEIELKRKLIDSTTDEGRAKLQVLDIERQILEVKRINTDAIKYQIGSIEAEITALRTGNATRDASSKSNDSNSNARINNASAIDVQTEALERQNAAQERKMAAEEKAAELERKRRGVDKAGFSTDSDGNRLTMSHEFATKTSVYNRLKQLGVDNEAVAVKLANDFTNGQDVFLPNPLMPGAFSTTRGFQEYGRQGGDTGMAILAAAQRWKFGGESGDVDNVQTRMRQQANDPTLKNEATKKIPKFAKGGYHNGGIRLVGENGPELEVTGPSQIINAEETRKLLQRNSADQIRTKDSIASGEVQLKEINSALVVGQNRLYELQQAIPRNPNLKSSMYAELEKVNLLNDKNRDSKKSLQDYENRLAFLKTKQRELEQMLKYAPEPKDIKPTTPAATQPEKLQNRYINSQGHESVSYIDAPVGKKMKQVSRGDAQGGRSVEWVEDAPPTPMTSDPLTQSANSGGKTYTVNINLNGKNTPIRTGSERDAELLTEILKSLENLSRRTF